MKKAFSLVELLVVILIISIMTGILLPALSSARKSSRALSCIYQMRTLTNAILYYDHDWRTYPRTESIPSNIRPTLYSALYDYIPQMQPYSTTEAHYPWVCPSDETVWPEWGTSYLYSAGAIYYSWEVTGQYVNSPTNDDLVFKRVPMMSVYKYNNDRLPVAQELLYGQHPLGTNATMGFPDGRVQIIKGIRNQEWNLKVP